jgi:hypothetical protein
MFGDLAQAESLVVEKDGLGADLKRESISLEEFTVPRELYKLR